ncbi:hypothetical protein DY000_02050566 [Brassica cretica]|uniref:Uncharacterized protein n=1 Tax=Brassica cretica TaxID=69181 RepID=A0ABQ7ES31_BRACR|nr:hypothetical protein DY000_02050566 [Brassica cretica]
MCRDERNKYKSEEEEEEGSNERLRKHYDIEPEFRRMLQRMHEEEKKLRDEKFKVLKSGIKLEEGQSSKGDGNKRKRRL